MALDYDALRALADQHGQGHIFGFWKTLDDGEAARLLAQVAMIDFPLLDRLIEEHILGERSDALGVLRPADVVPVPCTPEELAERARVVAVGEEAVRRGAAAALVVAGGSGTRLGYDLPKGMYPATPVTGKSLFQLHAEKILAASRRYGVSIPWYIMTSPANDAETQAYFQEHAFFGLCADDVVFFQQGAMPCVDMDGKLLLAEPGRIASAADGHGGTLKALRDTGALADMHRRSIEVVSYFQVDNTLIRIVDPAFLGQHVASGSEFSSKALPKRDPEEGLGAFCYVDDALRVLEYSDLDDEHKYATHADGSLVYSPGSIGIHAFDVALVDRLTGEGMSLPFHKAEKKVPCIDADGDPLSPEAPNGVKFEMFIFDAIHEARNPLVMMVRREEEFAPIKRPEGDDSPETARQAQVDLFGGWLEAAGLAAPRDAKGHVACNIEISPLFALDGEALRERAPRDLVVEDGLALE